VSQATELAFERYVETVLHGAGWEAGRLDEWEPERALFPARALAFIRDTQPAPWAQMQALHGAGLEPMLADALAKELDLKGSLHVLRHGFKFYGRTLRLACFRPAHGLNDALLALYARNQLTLTRQVPCYAGRRDTVDLVFALNGVPLATCELKNPGTGQNWAHAEAQYRARDPRAPLFAHKRRAIVHFAADVEQVRMTTRLDGQATRFLPFNRGSDPGQVRCGAGNPRHLSGYRTGYLWEEVLQRDRFLEIAGSFAFLEQREETVDDGGRPCAVRGESLVFPRYHQLDSVRRLVAHARRHGPGRNYLVQHSAGSGKTNSISWLAHQLASLHAGGERKVFDCVVVITDRRVLDQQLQNALYQIEHAQGVVKAIEHHARELAEALVDGTPIVITTLQKFPFVLRGLLHATGAPTPEQASAGERRQAREWERRIAGRTYAVIVDEAHSSQSGESARELKAILGTHPGGDGDAPDWEDRLNQVMQSRGRRPNVSFFAFTATPRAKTLELFDEPGDDGRAPFHVYSMRQAIEEGFILDVLAHYTTYATYFKLLQAAAGDPELPLRGATRALASFVTGHPRTIEQKTAVMVEHFRQHVRHRAGGRAKAMVVTSSRLQAVRYRQAFDRYIAERGYTDVHALVAFSGTVRDPETGVDYTESGMNVDVVSGRPIAEAQLPERFATSAYQLLLVANKYQTGFDQPLLQAMYVDRRLDGVRAVQTLSRLNRAAPGKSTPFVLDFVNEADGIVHAFKPYYDATTLGRASDPGELEALKHELDGTGVYHWPEVEAFARVFYKPPGDQRPADHARMQRHLHPAVDRFRARDAAGRERFRGRLSAYVSLYAFLSQVLPYADEELEKLYAFARVLLPHLPRDGGEAIRVDGYVTLQSYRLERIFSGALPVAHGPAEGVSSPSRLGTAAPGPATAPLSRIVGKMNQRFGTHFTDEDSLFVEQVSHGALRNAEAVQTGLANPLDKFKLAMGRVLDGMLVDRVTANDAFVTRLLSDRELHDFFSSAFLEGLYHRIHADALAADAAPG